MIKGWNYRSAFINNMAIGGYEKKMGKAWLTKDQTVVEKYTADPLCGFLFTVNAYYNMFNGMSLMNKQEKEAKADKTLPLFFVAGADDPVGNMGKGVKNVVSLKLYPGDRHEILNELDKDVVYKDILAWLENRK